MKMFEITPTGKVLEIETTTIRVIDDRADLFVTGQPGRAMIIDNSDVPDLNDDEAVRELVLTRLISRGLTGFVVVKLDWDQKE